MKITKKVKKQYDELLKNALIVTIKRSHLDIVTNEDWTNLELAVKDLINNDNNEEDNKIGYIK